MKFRSIFFLAAITFFVNTVAVSGQVNSVIGQVTDSLRASFASGMSGDGRFIVFESEADIATENPRNGDFNREIFLFDYAQRRIFQITNTKSLLKNTSLDPTFDNIKVEIANVRPTISNDGRWIAFSSNATYAFPGDGTNPPIVSSSNPGNFDANAFTPTMGTNNLVNDGNTEIWLYQVPMTAPVDLRQGAELPVTDLSTGTFTRVTNTTPSVLPSEGSTTAFPFIANDNRDVSVSDDANVLAFTSNRDLVPAVGNPFPSADNDEIFTFVRSSGTFGQVTKTPRGTVSAPIYSLHPTISGNGQRVLFQSNGDNPIVGGTTSENADKNLEIFFSDLDANGATTGTRRQITKTTQPTAGAIVNTLNYGRRMSRDGRFIAFDSFANLEPNGTGPTNAESFALYLYDATANTLRAIGPRSDADTAALGGDVNHYPGFTDYDSNGVPQTLVLNTRLNIKPDGTMATASGEGLNTHSTRPPQVYTYNLNEPPASARFTRLTKNPPITSVSVAIQILPSNSSSRLAFNLSLSELGSGNGDLLSEVYYLLTPFFQRETASAMNFATGATRIPVSNDPVPTPSPTATPTPTPTPSPSPTPTATPTPQTPPAVHGISPGMLGYVNFDAGFNAPVRAMTAVGSLSRSFTLPIELGGVTMTINGIACGLKSVSRREIIFVAPRALSVISSGATPYEVVINNNGVVIKDTVSVVTARPDIFTYTFTDPDGNVFADRARMLNVTNRVHTREPFTVRTIKYRGGLKVPSRIRLFVTGIEGAPPAVITLRIGGREITGSSSIVGGATLREPGVYSVDFLLPPELNGAGDVRVVFRIDFGGQVYETRLEDTAPLTRIL